MNPKYCVRVLNENFEEVGTRFWLSTSGETIVFENGNFGTVSEHSYEVLVDWVATYDMTGDIDLDWENLEMALSKSWVRERTLRLAA